MFPIVLPQTSDERVQTVVAQASGTRIAPEPHILSRFGMGSVDLRIGSAGLGPCAFGGTMFTFSDKGGR
jgi:hypothetical protein